VKSFITPNPISNGLRSDIQVLRGISVLSVIFYHLGLPIAGGFLGVDSFFVISGFVITGALLHSNGTIKNRILLFYKKRIRRILPSSIYIISLTMLASLLFLPRIYLRNYFLDAISSIFMVANIKFAQDGVDYLQQTLNSSPFLHFWSLGVEEQFYLLWPLFFLSLFRWKALYYIALPILFVASTITAHIYPIESFFSPTSRAWEFLIGAFVATLPSRNFNKIVKLAILFISSLLVCSSLVFTKPNSPFLQFYTLSLVLGIGSLIYVGFSIAFFKPLEKIGDISYSLYLIHWPIIAILLFYFEKIDKILAVGLLLFSLTLAKVLTTNFENPIRFRVNYLRSGKFWLTVLMPILILCGLAWSQGFSIDQRSRPFELNKASPVIYQNGCHTHASKPKMLDCDFGDLKSSRLVMLVGDSHAAQWFPGLEKASLTRGLKLRIATKSGCPAILFQPEAGTTKFDCVIWEQSVLKYINRSKPEMVIISNLTEGKGNTGQTGNLTADLYVRYLKDFILEIDPKIKVAFIGDTPYPRRDSVTCLSLNWRDSTKCDLRNSKTAITAMTRMVSDYRTTYFDSRPFFCNGQNCPAVINKTNVYRDGSHLSISTIDIQTDLANQILDLLNSRGTF